MEIIELKCELSSIRLDIAEKRISKLKCISVENIYIEAHIKKFLGRKQETHKRHLKRPILCLR